MFAVGSLISTYGQTAKAAAPGVPPPAIQQDAAQTVAAWVQIEGIFSAKSLNVVHCRASAPRDPIQSLSLDTLLPACASCADGSCTNDQACVGKRMNAACIGGLHCAGIQGCPDDITVCCRCR